MWEARSEDRSGARRFEMAAGGQRLSFRALFDLLEYDPDFGDWYTRNLAGCGLPAFFWEHPPVTLGTVDRKAQFALLEAPSLARIQPDPGPFEAQFARLPDADVISFPNLGGDALLVVPSPVGPLEAYPHLAAFLRRAPATQVRALWRSTAVAVRETLGSRPCWLSTSGLGVPWLHIRIDTSPKYYQFAPYRDVP